MQVSPARKIAFDTLLHIEAGDGFASDLLRALELSAISQADCALATEIVMGVLRWRGQLDFLIELLSGNSVTALDSEVAASLRIGLYQLAFLDRVPASASVNQSVELVKLARKRSAAGLVNAVLRKFLLDRDVAIEPFGQTLVKLDDKLAARLVPGWLFERWQKNYGAAAAKSLAAETTRVPAMSLRAPPAAGSPAEAIERLAAKGIRARPGSLAQRAIIIDGGRIAPELAAEMGLVIQDEASQLVPELLGVRERGRVLDLCAAPGMKTSQLADQLAGGFLIACDISARRLQAMSRLLPRISSRANRVAMVRLDATMPLPFTGSFDRILIDAPCSGTGTLAQNPEIKWRLKPEDINRLLTEQVKLLRNAAGTLAHGGRLVYATCSLEPEENENVVRRVLADAPDLTMLSREELAREFPLLGSLFDAEGFFHTRPDLHGTAGFFAAVIEFRGE